MIKTRQRNILNCRKLDPHSREDIKNDYNSDRPLSLSEMPNPHTDSKYQPNSNKLKEGKADKRLQGTDKKLFQSGKQLGFRCTCSKVPFVA